MEQKRFGYKKPKYRMGRALRDYFTGNMWEHTEPAYRIAPHVWNVGGQDDVSVYLLDTGEGLALIDTGYERTLYLVIDRMYSTGFNPRDVKKIFLTHYHGDHSQGARLLQELAGGKEHCEIWLSKEDELMHQETAESTFPMPCLPYEVTNFYDDDTPIQMGRFTIRTKLCPGHTLGVTSFFFEDTDEETGKTYWCAVHGGMGTGTMYPGSEMGAREHVTPETAFRFVKDCLEMAEWPVDINMSSHLNQTNIDENMPEDLNDYTWFITDYSWHDMLVNRAEDVMSRYPEQYPDFKWTVPNVE
ncbi:MAG: MBL fold metallo-hydrolase [Solobacterium sp.]|nr:MBL fold metallo-hydrolase [Solobacterium sp.]